MLVLLSFTQIFLWWNVSHVMNIFGVSCIVHAELSHSSQPAITALPYKYLNGSSAFRQSTPVTKIKFSDLLLICSVKQDSLGFMFCI